MNYPTTLFTSLLTNMSIVSKLWIILQWALLYISCVEPMLSTPLPMHHPNAVGCMSIKGLQGFWTELLERTGCDHCHLVAVACKCSGSLYAEAMLGTVLEFNIHLKAIGPCRRLILQGQNRHSGPRDRAFWWLNIRA